MTRLICSLLVALVLAAPAVAQETYDLRPKWTPGQYVLTQTMKMTNEVWLPGATAPMNAPMEMLMVAQLDISEADEQGVKTMTMEFMRVRQAVGGMMPMTFDSHTGEGRNGPLGVMRGMVGFKMIMKIGRDGQVEVVQGTSAMWDRMVEQDPSLAPMAEAMKASMNDDTITQMVDFNARMLPEGPVAVGQTWRAEDELPVPMLGAITVKHESKLAKVDAAAGTAVVEYKTEGQVRDKAFDAPGMAAGSMTIKTMDMSMTGQATHDLNLGMAVATKGRQNMTMVMDMNGQEMKTVQAGDVEVTITTGKYEPPPAAPAGNTRPAGGM